MRLLLRATQAPTPSTPPHAVVELRVPNGWGGVDEPWCTWDEVSRALIWQLSPIRLQMLIAREYSDVLCQDFIGRRAWREEPWFEGFQALVDVVVLEGHLTPQGLAELLKRYATSTPCRCEGASHARDLCDYLLHERHTDECEDIYDLYAPHPFSGSLLELLISLFKCTNEVELTIDGGVAKIGERRFRLGTTEETEEYIESIRERREEIEVWESLPIEAKIEMSMRGASDANDAE